MKAVANVEPTSKRFDNSRRLFESVNADANNWRDNEIAKKQEEAKEKDMQVRTNSTELLKKLPSTKKKRLGCDVIKNLSFLEYSPECGSRLLPSYWGYISTVPIRKPNRVRLSNSILCQSRPFDSQNIRNPDTKVRVSNGG